MVLSLSKLGYISRRAISFNLINKGNLLIEEFPLAKISLIQKKKLEVLDFDNQENMVFLVYQTKMMLQPWWFPVFYSALQHRGQEGCGIVSFDGKNFHSEKTRFSWRSFY